MAKITIKNRLKNNHEIPNLPIPKIETTSKRFLDWVEPLSKIKNYNQQDVQKEVENFLISKDIKDAQNYLLKKYQDKNTSYIINWWYDSYLDYQGINLNVGAAITWGNQDTNKWTQSQRAAFIAWSISQLYLNYKNNIEKYEYIQTPKGKISLDQFEGLFAAFRKMEVDSDRYIISEGISKNILFMYKNTPYLIEVIKNNSVVNINEIENAILKIVKNHNLQNKTFLNYIETTNNRNKSSILLDEIILKNKAQFEKVKKSIFVLCYDINKVKDKHEAIKSAFSGDENLNRWFAKSLNIAVNNSIHCPITMEHTYFDGASFILLLNYIDNLVDFNIFEKTSKVANTELIIFNISKEQKEQLINIKKTFTDFSNNIFFSSIELNFGKNLLKKLGILSVDGIFQLVEKLAQYKTFNTIYSTYEAVDMRHYWKGRTECIRPLSNSILKFAEEWFGKKDSKSILALLIDVQNEHYQKAKHCKVGSGVHRHMMGLKMAHLALKKKNKLPIIDSLYYKDLSSNRMSTSTIPYKNITQFAFYPVQENGYTNGYKVGENNIFVNSTSMIENKTNLINYHKNFIQIFNELIKMLEDK